MTKDHIIENLLWTGSADGQTEAQVFTEYNPTTGCQILCIDNDTFFLSPTFEESAAYISDRYWMVTPNLVNKPETIQILNQLNSL